jgi:putative pyoverdin transport system ATP-binding/permease protein
MKMLVKYLLRTCRREVLFVAALGIVGGFSSAALVGLVTKALHANSLDIILVAGFALATVLKVGSSVLSNIALVRMTHTSVLTLCNELCEKVLRAPYRLVENIGPHRILVCLTDDVSALSMGIQEIPHLVVNIAVLAGCAAYLAWLSWMAAVVMVVLLAVGIICYYPLLVRARSAFEAARDGRDSLFRQFRSLTEGVKELQQNRRRSDAFVMEEFQPTLQLLREQGIFAVKQHLVASAWVQSVFYVLLAVLVCVLPRAGVITVQALTAYVFVALFTAAPVWAVVAVLPALGRSHTALQRLEALSQQLGFDEAPPQTLTPPVSAPPLVEFDKVEFVYTSEGGDNDFVLGPLDISLSPGELIFVTGGNGTGKSTFVKVLTGLYTPSAGEIRVDGRLVCATDGHDYRDLYSVVYSDFFLFDRLLGIEREEMARNALHYLRMFQLDHKVRIQDGVFSTTTALSHGQRRRLALLVAYLENRPICVLDECAADQDPQFRELFYRKLMPELRARGKTVVVVTHDDRYFHLADRLLRLECGKVSSHCVDARI